MWFHPIQTLNFLGFNIQVWGLMLGLGAIAGWYLFDYNIWWRKIKFDSSWLVFGFIICSLIGARLLHVILHWDYYSQNLLEVHQFWLGGMASYGVLLGIVYVFWFLRHKQEKNDILDAAVPALFLALFLARTGCFLINDHIGRITTLPWGIDSLGDGMRHPISLYYMLGALVSFIIFSFWYYRGVFRGRLIWLMLMIYPLYRLLIDLTAKDWQGDNFSYYVLIGLTITLIIIAFWRFRVLRYER